jgi:hypothetical protein
VSNDKPNAHASPHPEGKAQEYDGRARASFRARVVRSSPDEYAADFTALDEGAGGLDIGKSLLDVIADLLVDEVRKEME